MHSGDTYPPYLDQGLMQTVSDCIWAEIQLVQYVLYLIVSEVEADTDCIHRIIQ